MNTEAVSKVNQESLPKIRAIVRDGAVQTATRSLAAWGAINAGAWFLLGGESREFLSGFVNNSSGGIVFLLYGGIVLGAVMLALAAFGAVTRSTATIFLDGGCLICIGLWNVTHDFIAMGVLQPYGYTVEKPSTIWVMLGICQIVWGCREFSAFGRMASWSIPKLAGGDPGMLPGELEFFVQSAEDPEQGIVRGSVTSKGPLGLDFLSTTTQYTGVLSGNMAIMVSSKLDDCFTIDKSAFDSATFGADGALQVQVEDKRKDIVLSPVSLITFKTWLDKPVQPEDIQFGASKKAFTLPMLNPWLSSEIPALRAASVAALASVTDEKTSHVATSYVEDRDPQVQAAALDAATQLKSTEAVAKSAGLGTRKSAQMGATWVIK